MTTGTDIIQTLDDLVNKTLLDVSNDLRAMSKDLRNAHRQTDLMQRDVIKSDEAAHHYEQKWLKAERNSRTLMGDFVYIAQRGNQYKVGYSTNPVERVKSLNATLVVAVDGSRVMEKEIHVALDKWRLNGEWFSDDPFVQSFVADFTDLWEECHERIETWIRSYDRFMLTYVG